jgi:exonuclease III
LADSLPAALAVDQLPDSHQGASSVADVLLNGRQLFTAVSLYAQWEMMPGGKTMYAGPRLHRMLSDLTGVLACSHRQPVVLAGDLNVTTQGARSSENEAAAVFARLRAWRMADCIAHTRMRRAAVKNCQCTDGADCSHVQTFRTGSQLDYAFVSESIVSALLHCGTDDTAESWRQSDHCPIVIDLDERAIWQTVQGTA